MTSCCETPTCCDSKSTQDAKAAFSIALVGNPNCGKTTLFNALTGSRQRVGNWPGVTVERKSGFLPLFGDTVEVIDLPGVYSLTLASEIIAVDECIACEFILKQQAKVIVNIVDASNLERHLYLTLQLLEMGAPVILALNMMDVARSRNIQIDTKKLSRKLGCPVVTLEANKGSGLRELKRLINEYSISVRPEEAAKPLSRRVSSDGSVHASRRRFASPQHERVMSPQGERIQYSLDYPEPIQQAITQLPTAHWQAVRLLEDDVYVRNMVSQDILDQVTQQKAHIQQSLHEDADILIADTRYRYIQNLLTACVSHTQGKLKSTWTSRIDNIVLNRVLGIPIFLGMMYALFFFAINVGGAFQDFFDISSQTIFVDGLAHWLTQIGAPTWLIALLANGVGKGINTTITFIPVIGTMFLFLAFLEDSGYMARAAFVIDRVMRSLGLPGKAFVPMIVGFGCNVPAVMAARTLENKRDRILTIMMSPFMSCGARLAIYAVFTAAFFPRGGQNIVFALYIIGILMAVLTGFILRKTLLKGDPSPLVMELPSYHMPRLYTLCLHAWQRLKGFVFRAGKLIVPICILIGALNALTVNGTMIVGDADEHSLLSLIGQFVTPIFSPMGIHTDNWPATVGLVTGILAKEVVVGTLNTLYTQMGHLSAAGGADFNFWANLQAAWQSIPNNFASLSDAFSNPVLAQAPIDTLNQSVYGLMYKQFDGQVGAFAYLLFILLYFPCVSTTAAMLRELHRGWSVFSILWMTGVAYGVAVGFYQAATLMAHPLSSMLWIVGIITVFFGTIAAINQFADRDVKIGKLVESV